MYYGNPLIMDTGKTSEGGFQILRVTDGEYQGIEFHYTKVQVVEDNGELTLKYEYIITFGVVEEYKRQQWERFLGETLESMILAQVERNETVYAGGTD